ncbi:MAG: hypothetical protein KO206_07145 [Methanomicrobiaceae archaeon]|nr:hypothetical protein [Methanomicrobiaceae archaeon]MDD5418792.1 hypothetical protein [Methanomicrobiaceae archaeon]
MPELRLTDAEAATLRNMLEIYLSDLRMEISNTDRMDFRERLKEQEERLNRVLEALKGRDVSE